MSDNKNDDKKQGFGNTYTIIGMCLGAGIGIVLDNLAVGMGVGLCLGLAFDVWLKKKGK